MPRGRQKSRGRGRGRGKRPRDEDTTPQDNPSSGFAAINSPPPGLPGRQPYDSLSQPSPSPICPDRESRPLPFGLHAPPGKVAIPPLKNPRISEAKALKKGRTAHACDVCRKAKAGCTGGNPCRRCKNANVPCVYGDGKRDKDRKSGRIIYLTFMSLQDAEN